MDRVEGPAHAVAVAERVRAAAAPAGSTGTAHGQGRGVTDLQHFVEAQDADGTYEQALAELREGRKRGHWMWFVLPQLAGLGRSATAQRYALATLDEARDYLAHPVLGPRLRACAQALTGLPGHDAERVLGPVDAQKLHSSMTLFALAAPEDPVFAAVLAQYFEGELDGGTTRRLEQ